MNLTLNATPEEVMRAVDALQTFGLREGFSEQALFGLALALEECATNIVEHAYHRDPTKAFQVRLERAGDAISIELRDQGPEFDPTLNLNSEVTPDDEDRPPGGWGLHLAVHYLDEFQYRRESGENVLRLTRKLKL